MGGGAEAVKLAVALVVAVSVSEHVDVPEQAPDHPAKADPEAAVAVSVTDVPLGKLAAHVEPQLIPDGLLVTVPVPVPESFTVSWTGGTVDVLKVAVTEAAAESATTQVSAANTSSHPSR